MGSHSCKSAKVQVSVWFYWTPAKLSKVKTEIVQVSKSPVPWKTIAYLMFHILRFCGCWPGNERNLGISSHGTNLGPESSGFSTRTVESLRLRGIYASVNFATIGSDNRIITYWVATHYLSQCLIIIIWTLQTSFSESWIKIEQFSCKNITLKMSSAKGRQFCLGLNVYIYHETAVR